MTTPTSGPDDEDDVLPVADEPSEEGDIDAVDAEDGAARRRMSRRTLTLVVSSVLLIAFVVVAATQPVPYVTLGPGPTFNTIGEHDGKPLITISGHRTYPTSGHLDLTTVSESGGPYGRLGLGEALRGWVDPHVAVVPTKLLHPPGTSKEQVEKQNTADFSDAEDSATVAAFDYLKIPYEYVVKVSSVTPGGPSDGKLKVGDVIVSINGAKIGEAKDAQDAVKKAGVNKGIQVETRRDGKDRTVALETAASKTDDDKVVPIIGVTLGVDIESDVTVTYSLTGVGGPSAGLMFSLGVVDKLSPTSVNDGAYVAGTGTIDPSGKVGPIGGIQQKMAGARGNGATIFLVPAANCGETKGAVPGGLQIAKVTSLSSAIDALKAIQDGKAPPAC